MNSRRKRAGLSKASGLYARSVFFLAFQVICSAPLAEEGVPLPVQDKNHAIFSRCERVMVNLFKAFSSKRVRVFMYNSWGFPDGEFWAMEKTLDGKYLRDLMNDGVQQQINPLSNTAPKGVAREMQSKKLTELFYEYRRHYPGKLVDLAEAEERSLPLARQKVFAVVDGEPGKLRGMMRMFSSHKDLSVADSRLPAERILNARGAKTSKLTKHREIWDSFDTRGGVGPSTEMHELGKYMILGEGVDRLETKKMLWGYVAPYIGKDDYVIVHVAQKKLIPKYEAELGFKPLEEVQLPNGDKEWILYVVGEDLHKKLKLMGVTPKELFTPLEP